MLRQDNAHRRASVHTLIWRGYRPRIPDSVPFGTRIERTDTNKAFTVVIKGNNTHHEADVAGGARARGSGVFVPHRGRKARPREAKVGSHTVLRVGGAGPSRLFVVPPGRRSAQIQLETCPARAQGSPLCTAQGFRFLRPYVLHMQANKSRRASPGPSRNALRRSMPPCVSHARISAPFPPAVGCSFWRRKPTPETKLSRRGHVRAQT